MSQRALSRLWEIVRRVMGQYPVTAAAPYPLVRAQIPKPSDLPRLDQDADLHPGKTASKVVTTRQAVSGNTQMPANIPLLRTSPTASQVSARSKLITLTARGPDEEVGFDLLFLGDTNFGESYQEARARKGGENILLTRGYGSSFANMKGILATADYVVANLETPVTDLEVSPLGADNTNIHKGDVAKTPMTLAQHRIRAVSLANRHAFDYGVAGLEQTLRVLDARRLTCLGAGRSRSEAEEPLLFELKDGGRILRIALFAAYDAPTAFKEQHEKVAAEAAQLCLLDVDRIGKRVRELKNTHPDLLAIAFPHWGRTYEWRSNRQRRLSESLFGVGIDVILGHGTRMLQEVESRDNKLVAFSLGNFVFNSPGRYAKSGSLPFSLVARLLVRSQQGGWSICLRLYPIVTDNKLTDYHAEFVNENEFEIVRDFIAMKSCKSALRDGRDLVGHYFQVDVRSVPEVQQSERATANSVQGR